MESEQQISQEELSEHYASMKSLRLDLLSQVIIFVEEVRAQSLKAAMKARDDRIFRMQKTINKLAQ